MEFIKLVLRNLILIALLFTTSCESLIPGIFRWKAKPVMNPSGERVAKSRELAKDFENKIVEKLFENLETGQTMPIPSAAMLRTELNDFDKVIEQLDKLNPNLLTNESKRTIHQVKVQRESRQTQLDLWIQLNHLSSLQDLLPPLIFSEPDPGKLAEINNLVLETPAALSRLQEILMAQHATGIRYPTTLVDEALDHVGRIDRPDKNPLLHRYQQFLQYSGLNQREQQKAFHEFNESFTETVHPAYLTFADFLLAMAENSHLPDDGPSQQRLSGKSVGRIESIDWLTGNQKPVDLLELLNTEKAAGLRLINLSLAEQSESLNSLYQDPAYSLRDRDDSYQALLNLISIQPALTEWFNEPPPTPVLIASNDGNDPAPFVYRDGLALFDLDALLELPAFELETLAYQYAVPGHHIVNGWIGRFQTRSRLTQIYSEGWSIYASRLIWQHRQTDGRFGDNLSQLGFLVRSHGAVIKAIIDVNILLGRWSEDRSIEFMSLNTPYSMASIRRTITWIVANPGISVSSYILAQELESLQEYATTELALSLPDFHEKLKANSPASITFLKEEMRDLLAK